MYYCEGRNSVGMGSPCVINIRVPGPSYASLPSSDTIVTILVCVLVLIISVTVIAVICRRKEKKSKEYCVSGQVMRKKWLHLEDGLQKDCPMSSNSKKHVCHILATLQTPYVFEDTCSCCSFLINVILKSRPSATFHFHGHFFCFRTWQWGGRTFFIFYFLYIFAFACAFFGPFKISEHYVNPFWYKSNPMRRRRKMLLSMQLYIQFSVHEMFSWWVLRIKEQCRPCHN
jgi:hypothetical protein